MSRRLGAASAVLLLAAAAPQDYGPQRSFAGIYSSSFEHSEFGGCWLTFRPEESKRFHARIAPEKYESRRYRIAFIGRSTPRLKDVGRGGGYGHLGMMPCEVEVIELKSVRQLGPAAR